MNDGKNSEIISSPEGNLPSVSGLAETVVDQVTQEPRATLVQQIAKNGTDHFWQIAEIAIDAGVGRLVDKLPEVPVIGDKIAKALVKASLEKVTDYVRSKVGDVETNPTVEKINEQINKAGKVASVVLPGAEMVAAAAEATVVGVEGGLSSAGMVVTELQKITQEAYSKVKERFDNMKSANSDQAAQAFNNSADK